MNSPDDLIDQLGAHAVQLAEWSQDPNNADAAVTLLVMAQHCNEAAAEIERLRKDLDDSDAAACLLAEQAADQCIRAEKAEADVARLREALQYALTELDSASFDLTGKRNDQLDDIRALLTPNTSDKRLGGRQE